MSALLHHIKPWIQRSIAEEEEQEERKMAQHTERKFMEFQKCLDDLELRVIARPSLQ